MSDEMHPVRAGQNQHGDRNLSAQQHQPHNMEPGDAVDIDPVKREAARQRKLRQRLRDAGDTSAWAAPRPPGRPPSRRPQVTKASGKRARTSRAQQQPVTDSQPETPKESVTKQAEIVTSPAGEVTKPQEVSVTTSEPHAEHRMVTAARLTFALVCMIGTVWMAHDALTGTVPPMSAWIRALALASGEMIFGYGYHMAMRAGNRGAAKRSGAVVLLCALVEIGLASVQHDVMARDVQVGLARAEVQTDELNAQATAELARKAATSTSTADSAVAGIEGGPKKTGEILAYLKQSSASNKADQTEIQKRADQAQQTLDKARDQLRKLATERSWLELILPGFLAFIAALSSASTLPLFERLLSTPKAVRKAAGGAA